MWNKLCFLLLIFFTSLELLEAQSIQQFTSSYKRVSEVGAKQLNFRFESMGFFQNNEYLGNIVDGYTLPGAYLRPKLSYSPVEGLYLEAGAHFVKYSGKDQLANAVPWFSARYCLTKNWAVIVGNLDQNNEHGLTEHLWEPERIFTDRPESGLQFLYSAEKLKAQTWVGWEQFIQKNDPFQEHFTMGITGEYQLIKTSGVSLQIPFQTLFYHQGGEINSAANGVRPRVQTHANIGTGLEMSFKLGERVKALNLNGYWYGYKAVTSDSNVLPFGKGHAWFLEAGLQTKNSLISVGHWDAFQFIAPKGRQIYQSISEVDPSFNSANRSLISARYYWQKNITPDARVAFHVEAYLVDAPMGALSYSYGFYLLLNADFLLKKF